MKLYDFVGAPNPKKVRVYLAEKGINVPAVPVNIVTGENRQAEFLKKNPEASIVVSPKQYAVKEKEYILFFEAKKKYFLASRNNGSQELNEDDS